MTEKYKNHWLVQHLKKDRYNLNHVSQATGVINSKLSMYIQGRISLSYEDAFKVANYLSPDYEPYLAKLGHIQKDIEKQILDILSDAERAEKLINFIKELT